MREICTSGSEGGEALIGSPYLYSRRDAGAPRHGVGFGAGAICAPAFGDGEQPLPRASAVASVA